MAPSGRFLLEISYANTSNRLLSGATVSANAIGNAASLAKDGSKTGVWPFTLPARIALEVRFVDASGQSVTQRQSLALYSHAEAASVTLHDATIAKRLRTKSAQAFAAYTNELIFQPDADHPGPFLNRIKGLHHE